MILRTLLPSLALCTALLAGCATPASYQSMTVQPDASAAAPNPKLKGKVEVVGVTGGKDTNPLWTSQVDDKGFTKALSDTIAIAGYQTPPGQPASYRLSARLQSLDQPAFGLTFDVKSSVMYTLEASGGNAQSRREIPITASGIATTSDAFVAVERLRIANERSILENLKALLKQLQDY